MDPARSTGDPSAPSATGRRWSSLRPGREPPRTPPRNDAERRAARWYRLHGWRVVDANRWLAGYELDLVVRRGRTLAFCEVKSKSGPGFGDPLEMVTPEKVRRIRRAAETWLALHPETRELTVRFDVLADRAGRLEHVPDAF